MTRMQQPAEERDYVLGTHDAEVERLAFQHDLWRPRVREAWLAAGIGPGQRVLDAGAGPGFATLDLAELVGPLGQVVALERSRRYVNLLQGEVARRGLHHVHVRESDLMLDAIPATGLDAAWCRWVACFVNDPALLVRRVHGALRPGGVLVMHEYVDYGTYRCLPGRPMIDAFVQEVMRSWRQDGGEPDIARGLPTLLHGAGFRLVSSRPLGLAVRPGEPAWNWPAGFIRTFTPRLLELGRIDAAWADRLLLELAQAEADPAAVFMTPLVLELVAERL
ncbi:MAG: methyltransferase domain-containing protein [Planctomycetes bacterium]|nr:methyltransferase domain-containing protein [Planctomycetota bacterium]